VALLALLEDYALTWDDPAAFPKRRWHLTYVRDGWRCMAPGCTSRQRMDSHHIHYRSRQGSNELWNLLTLCAYHHQQGEHGGYAQVRGQAPNGVLWRLGAPGIGEWYRNEMRCAA
jgi:5-methylcytosine-specific restriction endonuclease McrA